MYVYVYVRVCTCVYVCARRLDHLYNGRYPPTHLTIPNLLYHPPTHLLTRSKYDESHGVPIGALTAQSLASGVQTLLAPVARAPAEAGSEAGACAQLGSPAPHFSPIPSAHAPLYASQQHVYTPNVKAEGFELDVSAYELAREDGFAALYGEQPAGK